MEVGSDRACHQGVCLMPLKLGSGAGSVIEFCEVRYAGLAYWLYAVAVGKCGLHR